MSNAHSRIVPRDYAGVFIALLILLALTFGASRLPLGDWGPVVALTIAVAKALLVVLFFMHLRESGHLIWLFALAGLLWLAIMIGLTLSDARTRNWVPQPTLTLQENAADNVK